MDEFEDIHFGRRLVLEYPISVSTRIKVVILDSALAATTFEDALVTECAAMLVPLGKELDWVYSSEGGQLQLLASAGVSRLILFSRSRYAEMGNLAKIVTEEEGGRGRSAEDIRERSSLKLVHPVLENQEIIGSDQKATKFRNNFGGLDRKRKLEGLLESDAEWDRGGCGRKIETLLSSLEVVETNKKTRHEHPVGEKRSVKSRRKGKQRMEKRRRRRQELLIDCSKLSLASSCNLDDETLKCCLGSLIIALAPRICFNSGVPNIPFVSYTDNVVQRVVVEEVKSVLTGWMRVEDVELETEEQHLICRQPDKEGCSSISIGQPSRSWRRRLIFKRMPNLIQTEVLLHLCHDGLTAPDKHARTNKKFNHPSNTGQNHVKTVRCVDHNSLVHKYLPPIVAGFVLVASLLDACFMSPPHRPRILSIGVGGGALPIFLQKHFWFHIQVVDLDEAVLKLAKKHFGLKEDTFLQVTVGDGLAVVEDIAARAIQEGVVDDKLKQLWAVCPSDLRMHHFSDHCQLQGDPRVDVIIVDVDVGDARLDLSSPPLSFLQHRFLLSARIALQEGGMLAVNVVPCGDKSYGGVVNALQSVFAEVYELAVEDDLNRIVFALTSPGSHDYRYNNGHTVEKVKEVIGDRLIQHIRRFSSIS